MGWGTSLWMNWKQKKRRDRSHAKSSPFRELLQILFYGNSATVTVLPFASGNVVDRTGYESAVLAVTVEASQTATIKVETADSTAGPYEPVKDSRIFVDNPVNEDGEAVIENEAEAQAVANLDIDLIGCKSCVKITATNGTIGALALGDATNCPVKESI